MLAFVLKTRNIKHHNYKHVRSILDQQKLHSGLGAEVRAER